uniref:ATP-dependent DNA helicase n=1 Tax=Eptatretus burgeri TaxID=7764 RepID=A0A8C4N9P6_EPTBU
MHEYVRPKKIMAALKWLQQNNPLYEDVTICKDWEAIWEQDESDLWEAMTLNEGTPPVADVQSPMTSSLVMPNNYQGLQHLARSRHLEIVNVLAGENCFFHAVSVSLQAAGVQSASGSELRAQLGAVNDRFLEQPNSAENIDLGPEARSNNSELHARFSAELGKTLMTPPEYRQMMRTLNLQQMEVIKMHRKWCKDMIRALKSDAPAPVYRVFLSGPGGVGKSPIIKLLPVILTAFTGTAAFGIEGMTLHSAFSFACGPRSKRKYMPASSEKLNSLRLRIGKLKLLIIDEVSMVGADLLYHIHRRLQDIRGKSDPNSPFGDVSILAVRDLFQLQPVGQDHVFGLPSDCYARLHGSLWVENFSMIEVTERMRQKDDKQFADLLMRARTASCTDDGIKLLKTRVAIDKRKDVHTDQVIVILVKFDSPRVGKDAIAQSQYRQRYPDAVPIIRQEVQFFTGRGQQSVEARRTQFPLTPAWACTIHKVQGKTLEQIVVSMEGRGKFMPGQAYVAMSHVRTLQGLFFLGFDACHIRINPVFQREMDRLNNIPKREHRLAHYETENRCVSLLS